MGVQFVLSVMMVQLSKCYKSLTLEAGAIHTKSHGPTRAQPVPGF